MFLKGSCTQIVYPFEFLVPLRLPLRGSFKCFIGHKGPCTQMVYTLAISVHWGPSICYGGGGAGASGKADEAFVVLQLRFHGRLHEHCGPVSRFAGDSWVVLRWCCPTTFLKPLHLQRFAAENQTFNPKTTPSLQP